MVPEAQAVKGLLFRALIDPRCFKCKIYNACARSLRHGGRYRIVSIRRASHICPIIGDKMIVVEVEEAPIIAAIESKLAVTGIKVKYSKINCMNMKCVYNSHCTKTPLTEGEFVEVKRILSKLPCPRDLSLTLAELQPLG